MPTTTDTTPDTIDQLRAERSAAKERLTEVTTTFHRARGRLGDAVEEILRSDHPVAWEAFFGDGTVMRSLVDTGQVVIRATVVAPPPLPPGVEADRGEWCVGYQFEFDGLTHEGVQGDFATAEEAEAALAALREVPDELLDAWEEASVPF